MDEAAERAFHTAIETIEGASAVEVVIAVRPRARRGLVPHVVVGLVFLMGMLAFLLFAESEFDILEIFVLPLAAGVLGALAVEAIAPLERLLARDLDELVREAARATFYERDVHTTTKRTGLLVFLALREHAVALVGDVAVVKAIGQAKLDTWASRIAAELPAGGSAAAAVLRNLAPELGQQLPHQADQVNELPDDIVSIHPRGVRRRGAAS